MKKYTHKSHLRKERFGKNREARDWKNWSPCVQARAVTHACPVDACNCFLLLLFLPLCVWHKINVFYAGRKAGVWGDTFRNVRKKIAHCKQLLDAFLKNSSTLQVPCSVVLKSFLKVPGITRFSWRRFAAALPGSPRRWHGSCLPRLQSSAALTCCGFCLINRCWCDSTSL